LKKVIERKNNYHQLPLLLVKIKKNESEEQVVYETSQSEQIQPSTLKKTPSPYIIASLASNDGLNNNNKHYSKQILYAIMNSKNNKQEQTTTDEFFENGPHTNPEETIANITSSA